MAHELRHAGSTLRFARGQAVLGYYLSPLPGLVFRWVECHAPDFHLLGPDVGPTT